MTSTNDGKDVKSYQTVAQKGKTYYIEFYKSLEAGLSSECDLRIRTKHLCEAWRRIHSLCQHSTSNTHPHLLSWLQRHTAKIILQTEWQSSASKNEHRSLSEALNDSIAESRSAIAARNGVSTSWESQLLQRAEWFNKALLSPWGHATLKKVLDPQNGPPSSEEFLEWVKEERGIMVVTRLRQLAASKCNDLALSLATVLMDRVRADIEPQNDAEQSNEHKEKPKTASTEPKFADVLKLHAGFTPDVWELLVDIEFVLLHKCDKRSRCIELAKQTPLRTCYQLVERLENRLENSPKEKKLWKNAKEVATLIAQVTVARCMVIGGCVGACRSALYWCARALTRLVAGARLVTDTVALAAPAATARHLHTLAVAVHAQSTESMKPFVCELYVRALTAGMNELERLKMKTEKEVEARAFEQTLSSWFTSLGSLLGDGSPRVQCECTLTAFSVHPSPIMFEAIKKAPHLPPLHVDVQEKQEEIKSQFGSWANDSRSQTNFVKTSETLNLKQQKQQSNILSTAVLTEGEALGLSPELCQDIAVLLSGPRLKTLSWDMDRETLLDNCRNYMERTHGGTRALTTELKYLNLDPKAFQHLPEEDDEEENDIFYGIEKGYEHLVEFQPEEIWENATNSQGHSESPYSSSLESDGSIVKLKKKYKRVTDNLSEDSDPLSLMAQAKRKARKKERPHSKERSKDKKIAEDPLTIHVQNEQSEKDKSLGKEKKKEKRGRKKKDKSLAKTNPLSSLVGMKIVKPGAAGHDNVSVTYINDSDYDSQGKFSLNSIPSEVSDDVVFDGLYSMDELKSPEIVTQPDRMELLKNNELSVADGVISVNRLPMDAHSVADKASLRSNVAKMTPPENVGFGNMEDRKPPIRETSSLPTNINNFTEEVKKNITRLIDFRRHTNNAHMISERNNASVMSSNDPMRTNITRIEHNNSSNNSRLDNLIHPDKLNSMKEHENPNSNINSNNSIRADTSYDITKKPDNKKSNHPMHADPLYCFKELENNLQNHVTPKVVTIPNIPKVFISKNSLQETGQIQIINNNNSVSHPVEKATQKSDNKNYDPHLCNPFFNTITAPQLIDNCLNQNASNEILSNPALAHKTNEFKLGQPSKSTHSLGPPKQNNFQNFLKELQKSINAGAAVNNNKCLATQIEATRKEVKPVSRVTPVIPSVKKIPQTVQQVPLERVNCQKKVDNSLNTTFSRLSYMHKNRQNDSKLKQVVDALIELQDVNLCKYRLSSGLDQTQGDNKNAQMQMQPKINGNKAVSFNTPFDNAQAITPKVEKLNKTTTPQKMKATPFNLKINRAVQTSQLNLTGVKNETQIRNRSSENTLISDKVGQTRSGLSEKDQNDLILLLRQQSKLNTSSVTKKIVTTNSEGNPNISRNQTSCSSNYNYNNLKMDKISPPKINKNEQVDKSTFTNSSISGLSAEHKVQKCCVFNKPDNNPIISRVTSTTKSSPSLSKNYDLEQHNVKKTEINKNVDLSHNAQNKPLKGTTTTDWESVMNAILAHKTPSRGPNALDVALNKSSFAKAFADSIQHNKLQEEKAKLSDKSSVATSDLKQNTKSATKTSQSAKEKTHKASKSQKNETKRDSGTRKQAPESNNVNKRKKTKIPVGTAETLKSNSNSEKSTKKPFGTSKRVSTDVEKQFTCPLPQEDDPFISGIANSDYDLLEELMDDDLRQEIRELSSDDDNFNIPPGNNHRKSIVEVKKHTNVLNKINDNVVITKPNIPMIQKFQDSESNRTMPVSILKCEGAVGNVYTSPVQTNRTHTNRAPQLHQMSSDNMTSYDNPNVGGSNQTNSLVTNSHEKHTTINENILNTTYPPNLLMNSVDPQTFGNLVLIDPGITYEKLPTSQLLPQSNMNTLPVNTYVEIDKNSDMSLYETVPVVSHMVENNMINPTSNQDIPRGIPESLINPEGLSRQFELTKLIKPAPNIASVDKIELHNSISECDFHLGDQLNGISYKKGPSQINADINKLNECKVLSEVQEKQHFLFEKKYQDDLQNDSLTIANDFNKANDQDRLIKKRLCIINRKIHHYCSDIPIPLTYTPLKSNVPNSAKIKMKLNKQMNKCNQTSAKFNKPQRLESLLNVKVQKNQNETKSKENKSEKVHVKSELEVTKMSKEHKSELSRLSLQSSHINPQPIDPDHENDKVNGIKLKANSLDCKGELFDGNIPVSVSKRPAKESSNQSKDIDNKGSSVITKKVTRKKRKKDQKKKVNSKFEQLSTNVIPMDHVDIEEQILGSKIPKNDASISTIELNSNITQNMCDNSEVSLINTYPVAQDNESCNKINNFDGKTQSEINNSEQISHKTDTQKNMTEKTINNVIITPRTQVNQIEQTSETNEIEKYRDLIDLTSENKEPAKTTSLTQTKTINVSNLHEKENLDISYNAQTRKPDIITSSTSSFCEKNYTSSTVAKDNNPSGIPQSYKDSIKIIPLPTDSKDPLRKFVRIKLPNGRTFKATSYGKEDVDFDTLFSDPSLKSVLLGGLTDKTRYTLNIKQVATTTVNNPKKILETRIQEINLEAKAPIGPVETIDLLSDEENDDSYQHFKTEFGDFKIRSLENCVLGSHQKKFDQHCRVKLISLNRDQLVGKSNACDVSYNNMSDIEYNKLPFQIEEFKSKNVETTIENETDVTVKSDISNNPIATSNVTAEITTLKQGINEPTLSLSNNVAISIQQSVSSDSHKTKLSSKETNSDLNKKLVSRLFPQYENCYIKLVNCDDVVDKYKKLKVIKDKCITDLVKHRTDNLCPHTSNTYTEMQGIETVENAHSLSKTNPGDTFKGLSIDKTMQAFMLESGRTSPVIDAFERIMSLKNIAKTVSLIQTSSISNCVAEWCVSKAELSSITKANQFVTYYNRDKLKFHSNICISEWYVSKPMLSFQYKIKQYHKQEIKALYNAPKLTTIVNKYLQSNRILNRTESKNPEKCNSKFNHSKNLKRRLSVDDSDRGRKMTKIETALNTSDTNCEQDTYNSGTELKPLNNIDSSETESNKSFDFLAVCYDSDRESDVASNKSESILSEQTNLFDSLISIEQNDSIFNEDKNGLLRTNKQCEGSLKGCDIDNLGTDNPCIYSEVQNSNTRTGTHSSLNRKQTNPVKLVKKNEVHDIYQEIPKKIITEDDKKQDIFVSRRNYLETNGSLTNENDEKFNKSVDETDIMMQLKMQDINTVENNENNKQNQETYIVLDKKLKENSARSIQDLANELIQDNVIYNRVQLDTILDNITSSKQESSSSSTAMFCDFAPAILESLEYSKHKPIVKYITKLETTPQLPNLQSEHSHNHIVDSVINNKIQVTKTNDCSTKVLLDSKAIVEVKVLEDHIEIDRTNEEEIQFKKKLDQPIIIKENWDHEYTAPYIIPKNVSEVENSKSVLEIEEQKCDFIIDDESIFIDDKYNNTNDVIVENDGIFDQDYIEDEFTLKNKESLNENIVECFEVQTKYIPQQEMDYKDYSKLDGYNKDAVTHVDHSINSITTSLDKLKTVKSTIENPAYASTCVKDTNSHKNKIETMIGAREIPQCDDHALKEIPEYFDVLIPKMTYVKINKNALNEKKTKRLLKRKLGMNDIKISEKRYRKGKQIDHPKFTRNSISDTLYSKEFVRLCDYFRSVKFSYSQPFHKEHIDVSEMLTGWPIMDSQQKTAELETNFNDVLFKDLENTGLSKTRDPLEQTLAEELSSRYDENKYTVNDINENNFNMGFGEGSGRVIQNLEGGEDSKFSAATLSDVKQIQPFLLSEDYDDCIEDQNIITIHSNLNQNDQLHKIRHYLSYIKLKEKVQAFFRNTSKEFNSVIERNLKSKNDEDFNDTTTFPFGLTHPDFIEPGPVEAIVHMVQVGQLPVTAAAQNPVTCDPRVTQVSDASPPQCSENSLSDDSSTPIKTEYTELTTADLTLPLLHEYTTHNQVIESHESVDIPVSNENIPIETEIKSVVKIELMEELSEERIDQNECLSESPEPNKEMLENVDYTFDTNSMNASESDPNIKNMYNSGEKDYNIVEEFVEENQQNVSEKTDQIAHAMNAAGISTTETVTNNTDHTLVNILPENIQTPVNNYTKALPNTMSLQQALAQILPPVLNQNGDNNQQSNNTSVTPQVLHIVQGKNAPGNQITLVDNTQQSVINGPNSTPVLHFVQNKSTAANSNPNGNIQPNTFGGLSLVDTGLQQGGNQLLQIVNTANQKTTNTAQLLKQVNLLTNLANVQGSNEQKMVQFVCKSADGKAIQLNGPHPRSMVLRIQPVESPNPNMQTNTTKPQETQDLSPTPNLGNHSPNKETTSQQEIKSRSVYEENYAKFIQNSSTKQVIPEKSTSLPKFNQAFGKQGYQDGDQKQNEINGTNSHLPSLSSSHENPDCTESENTPQLDHISQMNSPPLLLRKSPAQTTQPQSNFVQQIKQTISPINIQSMHGSVIYRQIPVNLGSGQTINLITVPNSEIEDPNQKQQTEVKFTNQNEVDQSIIKIVPQSQPAPNVEIQQQEENNPHINNINNESVSNSQQPVLTQMRIKLPMLSKTPQMVSGTRVVRPSFFQIQRNVIGTNQQVYQQLVLTAAPPLGQQTAIRLPQTQNVRQLKVPNDSPTSSSESQMSSSTLEQLREFDLVLEQVKERSTVQPNGNTTAPFSQLHASNDTTDGVIATSSVSTEPTQQVLYSLGNNQPLNMSYVNRKSTISAASTSTYVRSPDSSGIVDSPSSSSHTQIPHTVTSDSTTNETPVHHKHTKSSKSKSRLKSSSNPPNTLKVNTVPPKTSTQKPIEDEQTTQRILYILAEYKEQVENSPDKDKPAPRRRTNLPPNPGSSKRKKSSSSSRRLGGRDLSPVHGDDTCRTMGSEDSSCGTSQGDCTDCMENHSPQGSPRKVVRKLSFEQENSVNVPRQIPQRNVIVADGQTITVARGTSGKPTTAVLMPANYILPVSMVKGGQQIAIVTNRGPKLLTVTSGEGGTTNALLLQRLITPAGMKPVLTRPGVRHVRLPATALHNLQAFNLAPVSSVPPPDSTMSPAQAPTPPELVDSRANTSPWAERDSQETRPERASSPEGSGPWNLHAVADLNDYSYEETVRTDNMDRTVLIVHKKEGTLHRQHRLTHVSAAALRHKYAILEHELRLQKSLSEECEDLGVDSPSASELFPEAELLFAASPAHDHTQDQGQQPHSHTPQPTHSCISQPDMEDQIATDQLLPRDDLNDQQDLQLGLEDVGIVTVSEDGLQATIALDHEEFARSHPNTTFHSEPTDETEMQPFTITGIKGRHITSTIFHSHRPSGTVLMTGPQTTVISQAMCEGTSIPSTVKYSDIENMIDALPSVHENSLPSVLVKDGGLGKFDNILTDTREFHLSNTATAIVHSTGNATQVIRRVCCEDNKRDRTYLVDDSHALIAGDDGKMIAEDSSRDGTMESMNGGVEDDRSSPERHTELFWESNSASERSESRRPLDYSSDSEKCCKSPYDETNSTDSGSIGTHLRLDSVIKEARGFGAECSSAEDTHPPLRTYPPKRTCHTVDGEFDRSLSGKTGVGYRSPDLSEVRRRASGRGVVKRGCHCCNGSPAPPRPKKSRQKKLIADFATN